VVAPTILPIGTDNRRSFVLGVLVIFILSNVFKRGSGKGEHVTASARRQFDITMGVVYPLGGHANTALACGALGKQHPSALAFVNGHINLGMGVDTQ
jgi:hypothetical protein